MGIGVCMCVLLFSLSLSVFLCWLVLYVLLSYKSHVCVEAYMHLWSHVFVYMYIYIYGVQYSQVV